MKGLTLRLGWRLATRYKLRTAALCVAVALPVAVGVAVAAVADTAAVTPQEARAALFGTADARVRATRPFDIATVLPPGTRAEPDFDLLGMPLTSDTGRRTDATGRALNLHDPITHGIYLIRAGNPSSDPQTIVLSVALAERLQVHVGDRIHLGAHRQAEATVTALAVDRFDTRKLFFTTPTARDAGLATTLGSPRWLVSGPVDVQRLQANGADLTPRSSADTLAGATSVVSGPGVLIGLGILAETMLLVAAALTVIVRSQRRHVGLLAAIGVPGRSRVWFFGAFALVVAAVGTAMGVLAGLLSARSLQPTLQERAGADWGQFEPAWSSIAVLVSVTIAAVSATVVLPARRMLRTPVNDLLREVSSAAPRRPRRLVLASTLCVVGVAVIATSAIAGDNAPFLAFIGLGCGIAGTVLALTVLLARSSRQAYLPGPASLRLAIRQATAFAGRTALTAIALAALVGVATIIQLTAASVIAKQAEGYVPALPPGRTLAVLRRPLTSAEQESTDTAAASFTPAGRIANGQKRPVFPLTDLMTCLKDKGLLRLGKSNNWQPCFATSKSKIPFRPIGIADAKNVQALTGVTWTASTAAAYDEGKLTALTDPAGVEGPVAIASQDFADGSIQYHPIGVLPVQGAPVGGQYSALPAVLLSPTGAHALGLAPIDADHYVFRISDPDRLRRNLPDDVQADAAITVETGSSAVTLARAVSRMVTVATAVTVAVIVMAMMALWAVDLRTDHQMLAAIGARVRWVRLTSATLATLLAALGVVVGAAWGIGGGWLFFIALHGTPALSTAPAIAGATGVLTAAAVGFVAVSRKSRAARRA